MILGIGFRQEKVVGSSFDPQQQLFKGPQYAKWSAFVARGHSRRKTFLGNWER